jgi:hypothetical protein
MLLVLTVYYLAGKGVQALPRAVAIDQPLPPSCDDHRRTIWQIIWSCLVTIFTCTWIAVHPNIPGPDQKWSAIALRRLQLMVMAVIAPELVIMWAVQQWFVARRLARKYHQSACVCFTNSKFADIQYLQNINGQRLMVFLLS